MPDSALVHAGRESDDPVTICGNVRATVCISSQVGCQMGCKFCATGTSLISRVLTTRFDQVEDIYEWCHTEICRT